MSAFSSTMAHTDFRSFLSKCVFLTFLIALSAAREICDKSKCPGPLSYYANLECKPIYNNPGDCCAEAFDCSHLEKMSKNKCYVNGHEYSIGENLREEDANPCDVGCVCAEGFQNQATFTCAVVDCFSPPPKEGCFNRHYANQCCSSETICLEQSEKRATCEVDGKLYYDGEYFTPKSDPDLNCNCLPGYTGENIEPFCKKPNRSYCNPMFRNSYEIQQKCAPVFYSTQNPQTDCSVFSRCQNSGDSVIHNHDAKSVSESDDSKVCVFGNMTMHIGDALSKGNSYESICVNCKCEVPPTPTCIQEDDCDYSEVGKSLTDTTVAS